MSSLPILYWVFNNTRGSLLLVLLLHASINTAFNMFLLTLFPSLLGHSPVFPSLYIIEVVVALLIIVATRGRLSYQRYQREMALPAPVTDQELGTIMFRMFRRKKDKELLLTREDVEGLLQEAGSPDRLDLSGRNLAGADLREANLTGANLHGADLHEANLFRANLHGADLREANLGDNLAGDDLHEFVRAYFPYLPMLFVSAFRDSPTGADLSEANLSKADLTGANLHGANLSRADLKGAKVTQEQLQSAMDLFGTIMPDGTTHP